jgi:hypothetical protein
MSAVAVQKKERTACNYNTLCSDGDFLAGTQGGQFWFGGAAQKQLIRQMQRKPELRAPASGPLDCRWGCEYFTALRGTGGLPA